MRILRFLYILTICVGFSCFLCLSADGLSSRILVEDFSSGVLSVPPWTIREFEGKANYKIVKEGNNFVLRLRSKGTCSLIYRAYDNIDFHVFKRFGWRWKVTKLPQDADIRRDKTDDQAAQIYVRFPIIENPLKNGTFGMIWNKVMSNDLNAHMMGYVWDTKAPVGFCGKNKSWGSIRYMVLESGFKNVNRWITESRNIFEDYKKLFARTPPSYIEGIGMMIDSDNTNNSAESFFDNLIFEKE